MNQRPIIYQAFPRILTNTNASCIRNGSLEQNGSGHLADYTPVLLDSLKSLGITHIWLTGVIEHATKTDFSAWGITPDNPNVVKGEAGSPYAIKDYYDIDPALAEDINNRSMEFDNCVAAVHKEGMKVIIDFVPNHTARVYHSDCAPAGERDFGVDDNINFQFRPDNNYYYITNQQFSPDFSLWTEGKYPYVEFPAKATGNDCFSAFCHRTDWYETVKINYGHDYGDGTDHFLPIPDTWHKMLRILNFWASRGVDGFRCDMVFMVPLAFWHWVIPQVKANHPDIIFIGEIYDIAQYRPFLDYGCFDYLYDKVNLYDTIVGIEKYNFSAARLTGCWQTVDGIGPRMLNFLENHDEVRYASDEFAGTPQKVTPSLVVSALFSSGPYMIYYGQELGEKGMADEGFAGMNRRSTIFDYWSYDTMRRWYDNGKCTTENLTCQEQWLRTLYARVLNLANSRTAFREGGFFDLMYVNLQNPDFNPHILFAFIRHTGTDAVLVVVNFGYESVNAAINIPSEAIEMCGLKEGYCESDDLLWNRHLAFTVDRTKPLRVTLGARDALLLPLLSRNVTRKSKNIKQ